MTTCCTHTCEPGGFACTRLLLRRRAVHLGVQAQHAAWLLSLLAQHPTACTPQALTKRLPWLAKQKVLRLLIATLFDLVGLSSLFNVVRSIVSMRRKPDVSPSHEDNDLTGG